MNKILMSIIGAMWLVIFTVGAWWTHRVETKLDLVDKLWWRSVYLNGQVKGAPLPTPPVEVVEAAKK